jgi:hypothetical protein
MGLGFSEMIILAMICLPVVAGAVAVVLGKRSAKAKARARASAAAQARPPAGPAYSKEPGP